MTNCHFGTNCFGLRTNFQARFSPSGWNHSAWNGISSYRWTGPNKQCPQAKHIVYQLRAIHSAIDHTFFELWQKWKTVVFSALPEEKKGRDKTSSTKDNVNSLKKKFETSSMKDNEAYVIMWTRKQQLPIVSILGFKFIIKKSSAHLSQFKFQPT